MTDLEFEQALAKLLSDDSRKKKKHPARLRFWRTWSRKKRLIVGGFSVCLTK